MITYSAFGEFSQSHRGAPHGNGVHFIWKLASESKFGSENDCANRFLENVATW